MKIAAVPMIGHFLPFCASRDNNNNMRMRPKRCHRNTSTLLLVLLQHFQKFNVIKSGVDDANKTLVTITR